MSVEKSGEADADHAAVESAKAMEILRSPQGRFEFSCLLPLLQFDRSIRLGVCGLYESTVLELTILRLNTHEQS